MPTPRTNLRKTRKTLHDLVDAATGEWQAERKLDADHIAEHINATREDMEWIVQWEAQLVDYVRLTASQMRERILTRQKALQSHLEHMRSEEPALEDKSTPSPADATAPVGIRAIRG